MILCTASHLFGWPTVLNGSPVRVSFFTTYIAAISCLEFRISSEQQWRAMAWQWAEANCHDVMNTPQGMGSKEVFSDACHKVFPTSSVASAGTNNPAKLGCLRNTTFFLDFLVSTSAELNHCSLSEVVTLLDVSPVTQALILLATQVNGLFDIWANILKPDATRDREGGGMEGGREGGREREREREVLPCPRRPRAGRLAQGD